MGYDIEIIGVPTVRAKDGLALSSRNGYLTAEQRKIAPGLHKVMQSLADKSGAGERDTEEMLAIAATELNEKGLRSDTCKFAMRKQCWSWMLRANVRRTDGCMAWQARLIDNVQVDLAQ